MYWPLTLGILSVPKRYQGKMSMGNYPQPTAMVQHLYEGFSEYMLRSDPIRDLPLNVRPVSRPPIRIQVAERVGWTQGMIFATAAWLLILGVLGMAPLPTLPVNDKALHFFGVRPL